MRSEFWKRSMLKVSPENRELAEWLYDYTNDNWARETLLLGYMIGLATDDPPVTSFWEMLKACKERFS